MEADLIFWPMIILALATIWIYVPMSKARIRTIKEGKTKAGTYRLLQDEPEESLKFNNAIRNQYESPVLFYAVCLAAYVTGLAGPVMVVLAFAYVAAKLLHVWFQTTHNRLSRRRPAFMLSYAILTVMWIAFAVQLVIY